VSYHFEVPYRADYTVPRYILEHIKAQTPQDAGEPVWPKSVKDLLWSTWRWVDEVHNRMPSGLGYRTSVSIPEPSDRLGYGWITALLLSRSFNTLSPDELPKPAELLPLNDNLVARIARNALYAEVHYDGKTFLRDNTTRSAAAHNPRYGVADPLARYDLGPIRHCILRRPSALGKMRLALHPSSLQKYPALMLKRELRSLGNAYPWELPEEQQLVDLASPAGQIVMTVAREHLAPQIQLAQRAQVKAAKTMIDFAQSILPADAV
jgi:hypothetical protein